MIKRLDFALYRSTYVDRLLLLCRVLEFDYLLHIALGFDIAQNRWVRIQKKRMLFLFVKTEISPQGLNHMEGIRHIFVAVVCNMGIKISPSKFNKFGAWYHLALV